MTQKKCTKCDEVKPVDRFNKQSNSKDGLAYRCKSCAAVEKKEWYLKNRESQLEKQKNRHIENSFAINRRCKEWREVNKEAYKENFRRYREELTAGYVALILRMKVKDLTPEILKLKREQVELKRLSRQIKTALKETNEAI